jgi:hypothetical protein
MFPSWASILPIALALLVLEFGHRDAVVGDARLSPQPAADDVLQGLPTYPGW